MELVNFIKALGVHARDTAMMHPWTHINMIYKCTVCVCVFFLGGDARVCVHPRVGLQVSMRACVHACVRACVRACV